MNGHYDDAVNGFSPDGHLLQVEYAQEAVRKGSTVVGLRTSQCIVLGVEKRSIDVLQIDRTARKIKAVDAHLAMTYAGLSADARVLLNRAQVEAHSHRLNFGRAASVEYIARYLAKMKQLYTQSMGRRPFGVACLIGGFDEDGSSHLFQTDPSGTYYEWSANTIGRLGQTVTQYLESNSEALTCLTDIEVAIEHVVRALLLSTKREARFYELAVIKHKQPLEVVDPAKVACLVQLIQQEAAKEQATPKECTI